MVFRYTDWYNEGRDEYGSFEHCKDVFDEYVAEDPGLRAAIYDVSHCEFCNTERDEGILFNENAPEYAP